MHDDIDLFRPKPPTTFGSAAWANLTDLRRAGMLSPGAGHGLGPIVGCLTPSEIGGRDVRMVYAPGEGHLFTAAPTRSGKGRGQIVTNLLTWPGSALVVDVKGENWEKTAHWRRSQGHEVVRFAPFDPVSASWNPVDQVGVGCGPGHDDPRRQENARYLANLMVVANPSAKDPYWDNAARSLLQGLLIHVSTAPLASDGTGRGDASTVRSRTMAEVRRLLTQDPVTFADTLDAMVKSPEGWVRETAGTMLQMIEAKEQSAGVRTILMEHTAVWAYSRVQSVTDVSTFSFSQLRDERPTTVYLVVPPEALNEYRAVLRVLIGSCLREMRTSWRPGRDAARPPVLFLLDEFPQLAYMQPIEEALLYIGSYGVKLWFFVQDLSQIQQHYDKTWRQFIANCGTRSFFGVSDPETARLVSEMSGTSTVRNRSYGIGVNEASTDGTADTVGANYGRSRNRGPEGASSGSNFGVHASRTFSTSRTLGSSLNANVAYVGRPLFMPDEVMRMPFGSMVSFTKGMPVMRGQLAFWDEHMPDRGPSDTSG